MIAYIVDRWGTCTPGAELTLRSGFKNLEHCVSPGRENQDEVTKLLKELMPEGLSVHGQRYLLEPYNYINNIALPVSQMIELVAELTRRAYYPDCLSRLQCFFGCETVDAANTFRGQNGMPHHAIYSAEVEQYYKVDMNLLALGRSGISAINLLHKYWQGQASETPFWELLLKPPIKILSEIQ